MSADHEWTLFSGSGCGTPIVFNVPTARNVTLPLPLQNIVTLNLSQIQAEKRKLHFARPAFTAMQTVSLFKLHTGLWSIKKKQEQKARASAHWSLSS